MVVEGLKHFLPLPGGCEAFLSALVKGYFLAFLAKRTTYLPHTYHLVIKQVGYYNIFVVGPPISIWPFLFDKVPFRSPFVSQIGLLA